LRNFLSLHIVYRRRRRRRRSSLPAVTGLYGALYNDDGVDDLTTTVSQRQSGVGEQKTCPPPALKVKRRRRRS
jgi:hypothetical protein